MSNIIHNRESKSWTVNYITSQGIYTDNNTTEPVEGKDYRTKSAWIGRHENNPTSFRSINLDVGD
ncbi:MAG: hypothetical protein AABW65_01245 [Nanoarchaeota archaeon]